MGKHQHAARTTQRPLAAVPFLREPGRVPGVGIRRQGELVLADEEQLELAHAHPGSGMLDAARPLVEVRDALSPPLHDEGRGLAVDELLALLRPQRHHLGVVPVGPRNSSPDCRLREAPQRRWSPVPAARSGPLRHRCGPAPQLRLDR